MVVDTSVPLTAVLGDLICTKARHRGVAGFLVDGLIRDLDGILGSALPGLRHVVTPDRSRAPWPG